MVVVVHQLDVQLPLRVVAVVDGVVEILGVTAEHLALLHRGVGLGPGLDALLGQPVVLDQLGLTLLVDPLVSVHAETLLGAVAGGDAPRAEHQAEGVQRLGSLRREVEDPVGELTLEGDRVRLLGVDEVGELDGVPDEEHAEVVADEVPVASLGVELHREPAGVARGLRGVPAAGHSGEADREFCLLALLLK